MIDLLVSIVSHSHAQLLLKCVESVKAASGRLSVRITVLDNASSDDSMARLRAVHPDVQIVAQPFRAGFGANQNRILQEHGGDARYWLLLNDDAAVEPGALEEMVRILEARPYVGIVGPQLLFPDGSRQPSAAGFPTVVDALVMVSGIGRLAPKRTRERIGRRLKGLGRVLPGMARGYFEALASDDMEPRSVDWANGAALMVRREMALEIGLLDAERFFMYFEDTDWCKRAHEAGWDVVLVPRARVVHVLSAAATSRTRTILLRSACRYFDKHGSAFDRMLLRGAVRMRGAIGVAASAAMCVARPGARAEWKDRLQGHAELIRRV